MNAYVLQVWEDWLRQQSDAILKTAERCPPWGIYQFQDQSNDRFNGLLCTVACYEDDGSMVIRFMQGYGNNFLSSEVLLPHITPDQLYFTPPHGQVN